MLTLIQNADAIVTVDRNDRVLKQANVWIDDGVIRYVGPETRPADHVIDAAGCIVYPGLINTHHHLYQTFTRNLPQVQRMELFPWLKTLYEIWRGMDAEWVYWSALTGLGELVKYGCTTCMDHHYVFPRDGTEDLIAQQFRAADALGIRFHATRGSMSRGTSDGGLPPDDLVQDVDAILKDSERLVRRFHDARPYAMHQVALAPCSPFSVTSDLLRESAVLARELGVRLHTHLCETKDEERYCLELFGMRPLEYMESCGWTGPDVWYAHGIHFNDDELEQLARSGTGVAHCPASNMKLASGVCRLPDLLERGIPVGLAVDGSASNDGSNLLEELRVGYLLHRLHASERAPSGYDMLKLATIGSARLLGREAEIGSLEVGKCADFFLLDTRHLELTAACGDPKSLLGTVGWKGAVDYTVINGEIAVAHGRLTGVDEERLAAEAGREAADYLRRS